METFYGFDLRNLDCTDMKSSLSYFMPKDNNGVHHANSQLIMANYSAEITVE